MTAPALKITGVVVLLAAVMFWFAARERSAPALSLDPQPRSTLAEPPPSATADSYRPSEDRSAEAAASALLATYACPTCSQDEARASPFVADSVAEAAWMKQSAFPSLALRRWTDQATLAEVEERAKREGGDMWALELIRKRCAAGDARVCVTEETGRALMLADQGRVYAHYVLAESYARLLESSDPALQAAAAFYARARAPQEIFTAALRGDDKASHHLNAIASRLDRPWSSREMEEAAFAAISHQAIEAAMAAAEGRALRQWPTRPTRALAETVRRLVDFEAQARAAHAAQAEVEP